MSTISRGFSSYSIQGALKKILVATALSTSLAFSVAAQATEATFLVQLNEYEGHPAYFTMYLVDPEGRYVRTLWVSGPETRWHKSQPRWWKYLGRAPQELDAITGASTKAGDREVIRVHLNEDELDKGYKVRVDSIVEDQNNYPTDVEAELSSDKQKAKIPGTGYVRYIRYKWD
ncbi:DUF2271 domain-containing protein [Suttonella ornithocola]|uniref:Predicted periplasmic protein (DUF2271) n=1 Tax=Suttonella ornithocola TaxID=279832 RepID=A0A380MNR4_9GAMM|nr:DUF2271 domain-containing protein [Suttonella ornithocola]SUO93952.1 Predicted periplasmic protein (DUF2271) [Suttonella ornithocola]